LEWKFEAFARRRKSSEEAVRRNSSAIARNADDVARRGSAAKGRNATPTPSPTFTANADVEAPTPPRDDQRRESWTPDTTQLFRYSALTFNGHKIHYDVDYCRSVEGYPNLVVHGPLVATMLAALAQSMAPAPLRSFRYRAKRPALLSGDPITLTGALEERGAALSARLASGAESMGANAQW
jgi:hydroxyacyl-ACP dehydratase HTD2-like protein with hotdog domain